MNACQVSSRRIRFQILNPEFNEITLQADVVNVLRLERIFLRADEHVCNFYFNVFFWVHRTFVENSCKTSEKKNRMINE